MSFFQLFICLRIFLYFINRASPNFIKNSIGNYSNLNSAKHRERYNYVISTDIVDLFRVKFCNEHNTLISLGIKTILKISLLIKLTVSLLQIIVRRPFVWYPLSKFPFSKRLRKMQICYLN